MTDSLGDLLRKRGAQEPDEIKIIKDYLNERFKTKGTITVRENQIILAVPSAALAGTLRMHLPELQALIKTDKKLILRIG